MKKPELLAPAGSYETLESAVRAGADAVYLGGKLYNARMNAKNFDENDMKRAVELCHSNGVRLYVTLNTLIYDKAFAQALRYAEKLYLTGVDALITADLGLSKKIKEYLPDFELHASTQVSGHNVMAAEYLAKLGFSRMVCARETSRENMAELVKGSPIEIEAFVHGAMCVSQSGQCLMSSFIGGRSGNRGECAQPCRLPYNNSYPLSLKDMCLASHVRELSEMGVASFKIEGRMKSPDYVYSVVSAYRRLLDEGRNATPKEIDSLARVFSRGGFSDGYYTSKIDNGMLGIRSSADKEATRKTEVERGERARRLPPIETAERLSRIPCDVLPDVSVAKGEKRLTARFYKADTIPHRHPFDVVFLPLDRYTPAANGVALPPVIFDGDVECVSRQLDAARKKRAEYCLVGNVGHIALAEKYGFKIIGDYRLNVYNNTAICRYAGFDSVILSPELTLAQIRDVRGAKSVIVYGKVPLMTLEKKTGMRVLRDRRRVAFPVVNEGGRELVLNSVPIYMADRGDELKKAFVFDKHFIFTDESREEVASVIRAYEKGLPPKQNGVKRIK